MSLFLLWVNRAAFSRLLSGVRKRIKIYDFPHFLCSGDSRLCLLAFGMVFLARLSGLQPVFQNPQSQTGSLKFYASSHFNTSERSTRASWLEGNRRKIAEGDKN
jgi:hypothetical protein